VQLTDILQRPIPDLSRFRQGKANYRTYPLLGEGVRNDEPLAAIDEYGIAGQSHYSRPNAATVQAIAGIDPRVHVRRGIAEKLAQINYALQQSAEAANLMGGPVELYVDEGYRPASLQARLYEEVFPQLISKQHPHWSRQEVLRRRDELIAEPPTSSSPSPHLTGAAVDINLRFQRPDPGFVPGCRVELGHKSGVVGYAAQPDYFEHHVPASKIERQAQRNRRILYWVMRGALLGDDTGFVVNPTEWWHWSYGDQLWAQLTDAPEAFYTAVAP